MWVGNDIKLSVQKALQTTTAKPGREGGHRQCAPSLEKEYGHESFLFSWSEAGEDEGILRAAAEI